MSNNRFLKWTMGAPDRFEVGMLVFIEGRQMLIGDMNEDGGDRGDGFHEFSVDHVERWTYLVRDFELQWYSDLAKGK